MKQKNIKILETLLNNMEAFQTALEAIIQDEQEAEEWYNNALKDFEQKSYTSALDSISEAVSLKPTIKKWYYGGAPLGWRASDLYAKEPRSRLTHRQNARETLQNCYILLKKAHYHSTKCTVSIVFRNFGSLYALLLAINIISNP